MIIIRRWSVILLSLMTAVWLAVPALALSAEDYAVLNVRYTPNGRAVREGVEFTAYKVAEVELQSDGSYSYTLSEPFAGSGIDISVLGGKRVNENVNAYNQLRNAFGSYINENKTIKETAGDYCWTATTDTANAGTEDRPADGIARFTKLTDGLYLVASNVSVWYGGTRYIPTPFLINIPYVDKGVVNNYLTVTVKPVTWTPGDPGSGTPPEESGKEIPVTEKPARTPGGSGEPSGSETPPEEPEIELIPEDVPLVDISEFPDEPEIEILEEDVPLTNLPQTGLLWWPVPVMAAAGIVLVIFGVRSNRKAERDE